MKKVGECFSFTSLLLLWGSLKHFSEKGEKGPDLVDFSNLEAMMTQLPSLPM
ncbi:MAG: hypothetical protein ACXV2C_00665 [Candidatus Bathyarchaeia archaeon]